MTALFLPVPFLLQAAGGMSQLLPFMFQIAAIFGIFYFLMIRPQQKQRKEHEERLRALKRGDLIFWKGHVAIVRDSDTIVHANAHHMATAIEPTQIAIARIRAAGSDVTSIRRFSSS